MADREVTRVERDERGVLRALGGSWGRRSTASALIDIQNGQHSYYVVEEGVRHDVVIVDGEERKHLRTNPDLVASDALDRLSTG